MITILTRPNICPIESAIGFGLKASFYIREQYFSKGLAGNGSPVLYLFG